MTFDQFDLVAAFVITVLLLHRMRRPTPTPEAEALARCLTRATK